MIFRNNSLNKKIPIALFFIAFNLHAYSQIFLALDKGGRIKRIHFYEGDVITFKTNTSRKFTSGRIDNIGDSLIIGGNRYAVNEISKIKTYPDNTIGKLLVSGVVVLPIAASLFLVSEAVSTSLHNEYPLIDPAHLRLTAGLLFGAVVMYKLSYRTYTIGKRHQLKIMDISITRNTD
jgi:hypothetical protein